MAAREQLSLTTIEADMTDFAGAVDRGYDLIFHATSNVFASRLALLGNGRSCSPEYTEPRS